MDKVFKWMGGLSMAQGSGLMVLICLFMLAIPYWRLIKAFIRHIVHREPLVIESFDYHIPPSDDAFGATPGKEYRDGGLVFLKGHVVVLSWIVHGAWRIDLEPVGRDLRGNAARIVLGQDVRRFRLKAYGFFTPPVSEEIEIPKTRVFVMVKPDIGDSNLAVKTMPLIRNQPFTAVDVDLSGSVRSRISTNGLEVEGRLLSPENASMQSAWSVGGGHAWKSVNRYLERKGILRSYRFSTKRYPNRLH